MAMNHFLHFLSLPQRTPRKAVHLVLVTQFTCEAVSLDSEEKSIENGDGAVHRRVAFDSSRTPASHHWWPFRRGPHAVTNVKT